MKRPVFQDLIKTWLWDNSHKLILQVKPDESFLADRTKHETELLKRLDKKYNESDRNALVVAAEELKE